MTTLIGYAVLVLALVCVGGGAAAASYARRGSAGRADGLPPAAPDGCEQCGAPGGRHIWPCEHVTAVDVAQALGIAPGPADPPPAQAASATSAAPTDDVVAAEATEFLRRLGRRTEPIRSPLWRELPASDRPDGMCRYPGVERGPGRRWPR